MSEFVICINNDSNPASLLVGKVYRTLPDAEAQSHSMLRVIDEDKLEPDARIDVCPYRVAGSGRACFDDDE